ncbi:helix-turn-helix domain-containing protein [Mucilaginibacter myungsuensis]|uniref:Helix-turn-helix transcriptional regulator n=1 Tax=Mucilaginibacter myungsuensis TaxID=649104 RepID=A0A929PX11_9SPHI|nr:AraC family transcriptional regulator [Mucilaginibacter myungsuensis]MBE9663393.1 helix-turn-helix transcriptional regulator [Mucilaginibacter myungsuensis]MDN3600130.1 AraC family transcriptional regulator [Mucilaginibacter myungsuensis]
MKFDIHSPCAQLQPYIKHLAISENETETSYRIIPDTALVLGFQYRGSLAYLEQNKQIALAATGVTGLLDTARTFQNSASIGSVLVVFKECRAASFLRTPLHEIFGESLSLEHFFHPDDFIALQERLALADGDRARIDLVETFLIAHLHEQKIDLLVNGALTYINQSKGTIRIKDLAALLNTSASPLEKRFRQLVGASPKKFASIVRARSVIAAIERGDDDQTDHLSAFYDQAHFIKEFKKFTSFTPEQYMKSLR